MGRWEITHDSLQRTALALFAEQGYAATSTAQIARTAGVSEMTLFRHFSSKEALLLDDPFDPLLAEAIGSQPAAEAPMRAAAEGIRQAWAGLAPEAAEALRARLRIVVETPALAGALERNSEATLTAIATTLMGRGADEDTSMVVASAVIAGLSTALMQWARSDRRALDEVISRALNALEGD